jgi:hypothetical protein
VKVVFLITAYQFVAGAAMDDPDCSSIDEGYFSNPMVDCDQLKDSEACETYKAK